MIEVIYKALDKAMELAVEQAPKQKRVTLSEDITDVKPADMWDYMKARDIPSNAEFSCEDGMAVISWDMQKPLTEDEKQLKIAQLFEQKASKEVYKALNDKGYTPIEAFTDEKFDSINKMYLAEDDEALVKYYSQFYELSEQVLRDKFVNEFYNLAEKIGKHKLALAVLKSNKNDCGVYTYVNTMESIADNIETLESKTGVLCSTELKRVVSSQKR